MKLAPMSIGIALVSVAVLLVLAFGRSDKIDFNSQVRPILNKNCLSCHGGVRQTSGVSFLFPDEALKPAKSGRRPIVPGDPDGSELIARINHSDPGERMPPDHPALSAADREVLKTWVKQGAKRDPHWSYVPPATDASASQVVSDWGNNEIDSFVIRKLRANNIEPSRRGEKSVLARRISLDLTGLPPTPEAAQSFLADRSSDAIENFVDTLLASPHFGERWASVWLDLARYADSQGYQKDPLRREVWRYRDWVIDAFNRDMPFDAFTIEQLAGDLLEDPSDSQILATAFHRNTMTNDEGGTDDEEFRVAAVIDRVNTTFEIWQGTTMACVQCHSHPYDPIRHEEYYRLSAFFNTTADQDRPDESPFRELYSPAQLQEQAVVNSRIAGLHATGDTLTRTYREQVKRLLAILPGRIPIMKELPRDSSRATHVFVKGNWLVHGDEVVPDTPAFLPPFPDEYPRDRLGLARWLTDGRNPLTARVTVNRFWEQLFGNGLVSTLEDFGTQGQLATHPELLDWLAKEFVETHNWSVKSLLKQIVLSATYLQASTTSPELEAADPYNKLLARASRFRLPAEQVRDQALAVSGLLNRTVYGPSVMPYQPEGVWNVIRHAAKWETDAGDDRYRRALYTLWRRVSPYPSMMTFDTPSRELCVSRRIRTNTPLQALVTLNDPVFVEAAQALAMRMLTSDEESVSDKLRLGFRLALMRDPDDKRLASLMTFYNQALDAYRRDPELLIEISSGGVSPLVDVLMSGGVKAATDDSTTIADNPDNSRLLVQRAALINVANVILNLDEFIMRG